MRKAWRSQRVLSPQAVRLPDGANVITLTVTDDSFDPQTNSSTDTVTITVGAAAQPPRANAGPDQTVPDTDSAAGENVTLSGAESSDPDGSIVSYVWRNAAGATIATTANAQVRLPDGVNNLTLTVTDNAQLSASDSVVVTVNRPENRPPVANAGPDQTVPDTDRAAGENVTLNGAGSSDPDGTIVSYVWRNAAGAQIATGANPQVRLPDGDNTITLTVTDNSELSASDTVVITVNRPTNRPPVANAGPNQTVADTDQQAGENVTLDGRQSTDADGTIASYVWRNAAGAQIATGANPQVRLPDGANTITLTVTRQRRAHRQRHGRDHGQSRRESAAGRERGTGSNRRRYGSAGWRERHPGWPSILRSRRRDRIVCVAQCRGRADRDWRESASPTARRRQHDHAHGHRQRRVDRQRHGCDHSRQSGESAAGRKRRTESDRRGYRPAGGRGCDARWASVVRCGGRDRLLRLAQ